MYTKKIHPLPEENSVVEEIELADESIAKRKARQANLDTSAQLLKGDASIDVQNVLSSNPNLEGGEGSDADAGGMVDPITWLATIPADWDKAEAHGQANRVVDSMALTLDYTKPETYCPCCQLPYPNEEHFFPVCVDNKDLGVLGPGFPMFFQFLKYNIYLLLFLTVIYFIPAMAFITSAYNQLEEHMTPEDNPIALRSIGAFLRFAGDVEFTQNFGACHVYPDGKFTNDYTINKGSCMEEVNKKPKAAVITVDPANTQKQCADACTAVANKGCVAY